MLHGDGPKTNQIVTLSKPITRDNLADVVQPDWDPASVAERHDPRRRAVLGRELDVFFGAK